MDFAAMAELCAPAVAPGLLKRIASVESSFNPYAIGVVGGRLARQPTNQAEALATASALRAQGWDYSVGLLQVNQRNFPKYGLTKEAAFDPCTNLRVGSEILADCYKRAGGSVTRTGDALSCYYAGNFSAGYRLGYIARVEGGPAPAVGVSSASPIPVIARNGIRKHSAAPSLPMPGQGTALFVSAPRAASIGAAPNDLSLPPKGPSTALLF